MWAILFPVLVFSSTLTEVTGVPLPANAANGVENREAKQGTHVPSSISEQPYISRDDLGANGVGFGNVRLSQLFSFTLSY